MEEKHIGSCLCGVVHFEVHGDFESFFLCHCKHCQKDTGSAFGANIFSASAKLTWVSGKDRVSSFTLPSTRHMKSFCQVCGSALPSEQMDGKLLVVPAGSLDSEVTVKPQAHIFTSSGAAWEEGLAEVKCFETYPS